MQTIEMNESTRTKILGGALAAIVGVWLFRSTVDDLMFRPIRDAKTATKAAAEKLELLQSQEVALSRDLSALNEWTEASLPPDINIAQRLYQEWITNLAEQSAFLIDDIEPGIKNTVRDRYLTVSVNVKAETDLEGLSRFMYLFDQANVLQRFLSLKVVSTGTQGNPRLNVSFTAEAMSVAGSPARTELFPRTFLNQPLPADGLEVFVTDTEEFPMNRDFLARIGTEFIKVSKVEDGRWLVQRGAEGTQPSMHQVNDVAELMPIAWDKRDRLFDDYQPLLDESPFVIPSPPRTYNPRLTGIADQTIRPGEQMQLTAKADGLNPDLGEPRFTLLEFPEGMTIDSATGEIVWSTNEKVSDGSYSAKVQLTQTNNPDLQLASTLTVTVRSPNTPPTVKLPESAIVVLGQKFSATATAGDRESPESLTFSIGAGAPQGLAIDSKTGVLTWEPAFTVTPGDYNVEVTVTDGGSEALTATAAIRLNVQDDSAALTHLTGSVAKDDVWYAWFRNRGTGAGSQLKVGDRLVVSEIDAEIVEIERRYVRVRDVKGLWEVALGATVRERVLIEPAEVVSQPEVPASETPAEAVPDAVAPSSEDTAAGATGSEVTPPAAPEVPDTSSGRAT